MQARKIFPRKKERERERERDEREERERERENNRFALIRPTLEPSCRNGLGNTVYHPYVIASWQIAK